MSDSFPLAPAISPDSKGGHRCAARLDELEAQVERLSQQVAHVLHALVTIHNALEEDVEE
jgi:hypothetical protein